jgi:hypothetical protein
MATKVDRDIKELEQLAAELNENGATPEGRAIGMVLARLEMAEADSARLNWLAETYGDTLGGRLVDHTAGDPDEGGLRFNIDMAAGTWPEPPTHHE